MRGALQRGAEQIEVKVAGRADRFLVFARFSPRERDLLLAGGLIAWLRAGHRRPFHITSGASGAADQGALITTPYHQDRVT